MTALEVVKKIPSSDVAVAVTFAGLAAFSEIRTVRNTLLVLAIGNLAVSLIKKYT